MKRTLNIADNLIRFRHKKKITQEQLACFIGVTKASVSKWETGQSIPDVVFLPQLAAFFDVSVDELLGYEPQLSQEEIAKIYQKLALDYAEKPFEEVMEESKKLVKEYYSCYPFLLRICILWLNHIALADGEERQRQIFAQIWDLCEHILSSCEDLGVCSDATIFKSYIGLKLGRVQETIHTLEAILKPQRLMNSSDTMLIQAYLISGDVKKADSFAQISMYQHLLALIGSGIEHMGVHREDINVCEKTIHRMETIIDIYQLEEFQPNMAANFYYQAAVIYSTHGETQKAINWLEKFSKCVIKLLSEGGLTLHGDDYFDLLEDEFVQRGIDENAPRNRKLVVEDIRHLLENPVFTFLEKEDEFQKLKRRLKEVQ